MSPLRTVSWRLFFNAAAVVMLSAPNTPGAQAAVEVNLSSALHCRSASHSPLAIRFAPNQDLIAVALRHNPAFGRPSVHLIIASRSDGSARLLGDVTEPNMTRDREILWWSVDGDYVALASSNSICVLGTYGNSRCDVAFDEREGMVVGFVRGPSVAVLRGSYPAITLDFYGTNCVLSRSQPIRVEGYLGVATSPDGNTLAVLSKNVVITDAQGQNAQPVQLDWSNARQEPIPLNFMNTELRGRYTESGRTLCIASSHHTHCFDTDTARPTGRLPGDMKGRMSDGSVAGTRILYPVYDATAVGLLGIPKGNVDSRLVGCSVWDYRKGREIFRWGVPKVEKLGFPRFAPPGPAAAFALSAAGDCLAVARGGSLWLHALPSD